MNGDVPSRLLTALVSLMPVDRREWGTAMLAELTQVEGSAARWSFVISCSRVALFPPQKFGMDVLAMIRILLPVVLIGVIVGFALLKPELGGAGLAFAFAVYGLLVLAIPSALFGNVIVLGVVAWVVVSRFLGRPPWPRTHWLRHGGRLTLEIVFGLLNPVLYLSILTAGFGLAYSGAEWWLDPLMALAWILLIAFWTARVCGGAIDSRSLWVRATVRGILFVSLGCLLVFALKDTWFLIQASEDQPGLGRTTVHFLRLCPLYLIPALLLADHLRASLTGARRSDEADDSARRFFLLQTRTARYAVVVLIGMAIVTLGQAAHRRSEGNVRRLVSDHQESISLAASNYNVDPRLIAAILFVTHRDQLSPFRDSFERVLIHAWGMRQFPALDINEVPLLNVALDISVGLTQIKPRSAQTASLLARGYTPDALPDPEFELLYRNIEPIGVGWPPSVVDQLAEVSPLPVPAERREVAKSLLNEKANLETCALILALYQKQWELTNPAWSIRTRPDILATLYQIGFSRSKPHGAPRSNAFGDRVRQVYEQPWLAELFGAFHGNQN